MSDLTCALCGKQTEGEAMIGDRYYCHMDDGETCYMKARQDLSIESVLNQLLGYGIPIDAGTSDEKSTYHVPTYQEILYAWIASRVGIVSESDALEEFNLWFDNVRANVWGEGFDAGERDVWEHEIHGWDTPCIKNPYDKGNDGQPTEMA